MEYCIILLLFLLIALYECYMIFNMVRTLFIIKRVGNPLLKVNIKNKRTLYKGIISSVGLLIIGLKLLSLNISSANDYDLITYLIFIEMFFLFPLIITLAVIFSIKNGVSICTEGITNKNIFYSWNQVVTFNEVDDEHIEVIVQEKGLFSDKTSIFIESECKQIVEIKKHLDQLASI